MILFLWILVQILGESLPISSSSHVQLVQKILNFFNFDYQIGPEFWVFDFLLHGPTILILLCYFFTTWWKLIFHQSVKFSILFQPSCYSRLLRPLLFMFVADLITYGFWMLDVAHYPLIQAYFLPFGFCCTALFLLFSRFKNSNKILTWSLKDATALGVVQGLSLLPGISRFASTYSAALWLGYNRTTSFAISFLIQIPLLCAGFLKALWALYHTPEIGIYFKQSWVCCMIIIVSLISYRMFCFVGRLIEQNRLWYFSYYMIIPIVLSIGL